MKTIDRIIKILYLILFSVTPLIFTFFNSELFEIPKMYFVYLITITIVCLHLINWFFGNTHLLQKNFFNLPLLLFLISQIICTFTSIDIYTSFYGYSSRLNGGLLSVISFSFLYWSILPYIDEKFKKDIINFSLLSGIIVAIYGILEHFGIDQNIWVQDVQSRVFSTLGQPNWLAAYLAILLPLSINKITSSSTKKLSTFYFLLSICLYICLLFTKSKSGILAVIVSLFIFFIVNFLQNKKSRKLLIINYSLFIILSLLINNPIKDLVFPTKLDIRNSTLEINNLNITPSGDIRKIVWQGSFDLFKKFPLVGTGVETFAYSYYWTRSSEHNLTSEWDFLYNKAHNEYLNFLATTGIVGTIPYLILIFTVLFFLIKNLIRNSTLDNSSLSILCSFISILITNAAGFSVVTVSLFFFLLPALIDNEITYQNKPHHFKTSKIFIFITIFFFTWLVQKNISNYFADIFFAKSESSDSHQDYQSAYKQVSQSLDLSPNNPNYLIGYSTAAAKMAILTKDSNYINQATQSADRAVNISPANINFWKQRAQIYFYLSSIDSNYFIKTVDSMLQASKLAPTDAKIYYSLGQFLESASLVDDAAFYYQKAVDLKPNYDHAYFALGKIYYDQKKYDQAKINLEQTIKYAPANTDAQKLIDEINKVQKVKQ